MGRLSYVIIARAGSCNSAWLARPCLLQKNGKGTVKKCAKTGCVTVPFAKKSQRHGRKVWAGVVRDRAFRKKTLKARSKSGGRGSCATVPFTKKRQRHGRKAGARVVRDRAFYKKTSKARSKSAPRWDARPCLLQKNAKGTVGKVPARWPAPFYKEAAFGGSL